MHTLWGEVRDIHVKLSFLSSVKSQLQRGFGVKINLTSTLSDRDNIDSEPIGISWRIVCEVTALAYCWSGSRFNGGRLIGLVPCGQEVIGTYGSGHESGHMSGRTN
jgi:hypothetical protein